VPQKSDGEDKLDLITVYRSMDVDAAEDTECLVDLLTDAGIQAVAYDDSAPGVPKGTFEVRVPAADAARAEELIEENPLPDESEEVDPSSELDLETIYHSESSATGEMEAMGIKNLLNSNGIAAVLIGDSVLPNFPFEVRVAHHQVERARSLIADAEKTGPAAAAEAELESESGG
jgi:Putative prokaryotic signal transducing protein